MNWRILSVLALGLVLLVSALAVVISKHETRKQYQKLVSLEKHRDALEIDWGRLQLEQSSWATHSRIETLARKRLHMVVPDVGESVMVTP
ncbi:MAG TPA: cell division protein FtsL [Gammaproteobacteria bacterium]|nr:cell division protein FtsL [Gammaproteobacteria bacterium]